jgi:hypothetical protein
VVNEDIGAGTLVLSLRFACDETNALRVWCTMSAVPDWHGNPVRGRIQESDGESERRLLGYIGPISASKRDPITQFHAVSLAFLSCQRLPRLHSTET